MTYFIKLKDGEPTGNPILEKNFRQLFASTSLPKCYTADVVEPLGYGIYDFSSQPDLARYQKAVEVSPVRSDEGIWRQAWVIVEMDDAEKAEADSLEAESTRLERNYRLAQTDWLVIKAHETGAAMDQAWVDYRQALRDITAHVNFPYLSDSDWPVKPD